MANPLHYPLQHPLTGSIAFRGSDEAARSRLHADLEGLVSTTTSRGSFGSLDRRHRVDESGLETIDADAVLSSSVVQHKRLIAVHQHLVGALVRRREWRAVTVSPDEHETAVGERSWHRLRFRTMWNGRTRCQLANCLAKSR